MEQIERSTGITPARLMPVEFPDVAEAIWEAWCDLSDSRESGFGVGPLTFTEIDAYMRATGRILRAWEVRTLKDIDRIFRRVMS